MLSCSAKPCISLCTNWKHYPRHKILMMESWKLVSLRSWRENMLVTPCGSWSDSWIMFLTLPRSTEVSKNLESSFSLIDLNNFSIPLDRSGEPQNDILDDELLLLSSLSLSFLWLPFLGVWSEANLDFSEDDNDLIIFGALESLELTDLLDDWMSFLFLIRDDFLGAACMVSLGSWENSLVGELELILMMFLLLDDTLIHVGWWIGAKVRCSKLKEWSFTLICLRNSRIGGCFPINQKIISCRSNALGMWTLSYLCCFEELNCRMLTVDGDLPWLGSRSKSLTQ
jgi:hypothetical protein